MHMLKLEIRMSIDLLWNQPLFFSLSILNVSYEIQVNILIIFQLLVFWHPHEVTDEKM